MKISIKTLQQTAFTIEVDSAKEKIVASGNAPDISRIKLIHSGKILSNEKTIGDYSVKDGDHMVLMITQAPSQMKPTTKPPVADAPNKTDSKLSETGSGDKKKDDDAEETEEFKKSVQTILEMGFSDREIVSKALKLAAGNPDRAGEIFELLEEELDGDNDDLDAEQDENAPNPLAYLRSDPQFQQMRSIIQANPHLLPQFMEQLRQSNPEIFDLISNNSSAFVRLMQEGLVEGEDDADAETSIPTNVIQVTEAEKAAIERLEQLGFDRARAIEAYFACDKNEDLAANFLLESMQEDD